MELVQRPSEARAPAVSESGPGTPAPPARPAGSPATDAATNAVTADDDAPSERSGWRLYTVLASLFLSVFVAALDQTMLATSTPTIAATLHSAAGYVWIGGANLLATAATGPLWARASDIWGRKPALLAALAVFGAASALGGASQTMAQLLAARALQGVGGGGGLMTLVTITLADLFSVRRRARYLGLLAGVWAAAGTAGPLVGGLLTGAGTATGTGTATAAAAAAAAAGRWGGWRWCFWIHLPTCAAAFVLVLLFLDIHRPRTRLADGLRAADGLGILLLLALVLLLLLGLDLGGAARPWRSPTVVGLLVAAAAAAAAFVYTEARLADHPLLPLRVFAGGGGAGNAPVFVAACAQSMVAAGCEFYLPLYWQSARLASPLRSGLLLAPLLAAEAAVDAAAAWRMHATGQYRALLRAGAALMALGTGLLCWLCGASTGASSGAPTGAVVAVAIVAGVGTAALFQAPLLAVQNTARPADTAAATAGLGFARNVATALSVVLGGAVLQNTMQRAQPALAAAGLPPADLAAFAGAQAAAHVDRIAALADAAQRRAVQAAFAASLRAIFALYTGLAALSLAATLCVQQPRRLQSEHTETKTGLAHLARREDHQQRQQG